MDIAYVKRFRMDINLFGRDLTPTPVPKHYYFLPWEESLLDAFARAKYLSFRGEMDTNVFPCLAEFEGCRRLMQAIVRKPGFLPRKHLARRAIALAAGRGPSIAAPCRASAISTGPARSRISASPASTAAAVWAGVCCCNRWRDFGRRASVAFISK